MCAVVSRHTLPSTYLFAKGYKMKQIAYYEAFAENPLTYNYNIWVGMRP